MINCSLRVYHVRRTVDYSPKKPRAVNTRPIVIAGCVRAGHYSNSNSILENASCRHAHLVVAAGAVFSANCILQPIMIDTSQDEACPKAGNASRKLSRLALSVEIIRPSAFTIASFLVHTCTRSVRGVLQLKAALRVGLGAHTGAAAKAS